MHYFSLDHLIVYAFLLITLVIGLRASRGIKSVREYAVANKSFGTLALVLTYLATNIAGASIFNITGIIFDDGAIITAALLALLFTFLFLSFFVAPHATKFPACVTMGDLVGTLYGPTSKLIAGFLGLFTAFCIATMELSMLGEVGQSLLGWPRQGTIVVGGVLLACYTAYGGIKSVTATDVFQFLVLLVGIPILAIITVEEAGGMKQVFAQVPAEKLQILEHPQFTHYLALALIWLIPLGIVDPCIVQRMLMGKTGKQLRDQYLVVAVFDPALQLTLLLIGLSGLVLYPHLKGLQLVPHIVHHLIPVGLKGLIMAGLLGIVTSTVDSYIHAMGLTAVHDILQPALGHRLKEAVEIRYTRYATVFLSLVAIYAALHTSNFLGLMLLSLEFAGPLLMLPIIAGMMGLKPDKRAFYVSVGVTFLALVVAKRYLSEEEAHWVALTGVVANGLSFLGVHWFRHKGFAIMKRDTGVSYVYLPSQESMLSRLQRLIPTPRRLVAYSRQQVDKYGAPYTLLGVFCCLNFTFPYFMWKHETTGLYETMLYLRVLGAVLCGLLIVRDKWPSYLLPYLPTFWHLTLLYCLPFTGTVMFLITQGSAEWLINIAITIMFLIVLVDWLSFIILTLLGISLGLLFHHLALGPISLQLDFSTGYLLMYTLIFSTLIALLFARRREQHLDAKLQEISAHYHSTTGSVNTDASPAVFRIVAMIEREVQDFLRSYLRSDASHRGPPSPDAQHSTPDYLHYLFPTALEIIQQGEHIRPHLVEEIRQSCIDMQAHPRSIRACVTTILENYTAHSQQSVSVSLSEDYLIRVSFMHLQYATIHILRFAHAHGLDSCVSLRTTLNEGIHIRLSGRALSHALIQQLFSLFPAQASAQHLGIAISKLLLEAHGGQLLCRTNHTKEPYTEFILTIPPAESHMPTMEAQP